MKTPPHIQKLIEQAKVIPLEGGLYWKLRCIYIEKYHDKTYSDEERSNCYMLWKILANRL